MSKAVKPDLAARRLAGAVVAALAACSGTALAQQQPGVVTGSNGGVVVNSAGECWRAGSAPQQVACPPSMTRSATAAVGSPAAPSRERAQLAQARSGERAGTPIAPAAGGSVPARNAGDGVIEHGYVNSPQGANYRTAYGQCWRMGYWTPEMAAEPCDAVARASVAPAPVAVAPQPEPAPAPQAAPEPAPAPLAAAPRGPMIQKITLETDVLFEFDKAELRSEGRQKLDEIAEGLKDARVDEIVAIGHTDRIGAENYNAKLSERRANAVKEYLAQRGVSSDRIQTEGRGEQNPVTGDDCKGTKGKKLISCFQPDRRVEIEVFGTREVAASEQAPATGATGATGSQPQGGSAGSSR